MVAFHEKSEPSWPLSPDGGAWCSGETLNSEVSARSPILWKESGRGRDFSWKGARERERIVNNDHVRVRAGAREAARFQDTCMHRRPRTNANPICLSSHRVVWCALPSRYFCGNMASSYFCPCRDTSHGDWQCVDMERIPHPRKGLRDHKIARLLPA